MQEALMTVQPLVTREQSLLQCTTLHAQRPFGYRNDIENVLKTRCSLMHGVRADHFLEGLVAQSFQKMIRFYPIV